MRETEQSEGGADPHPSFAKANDTSRKREMEGRIFTFRYHFARHAPCVSFAGLAFAR